jgi:hypothetical protein
MRIIQWAIWELLPAFQYLASQPPRLAVKNSKVEAGPLESSDQVMEVVGKVAVKIGLSLRWKIWEWQ